MQLETLFQYIPTFKEIAIPAIVAFFFWVVRRGGSPLIRRVSGLIRSSRLSELKRAKKMRVDPFAIQRQIAKEGALFCAFLVAAIISLGLMLVAHRVTPSEQQFAYFVTYMIPVLGLEIWWLWHRDFVNVLIEEASRIGYVFKRSPPPRIQSERRRKDRESRRALFASRPKKAKPSIKRVGRRLI